MGATNDVGDASVRNTLQSTGAAKTSRFCIASTFDLETLTSTRSADHSATAKTETESVRQRFYLALSFRYIRVDDVIKTIQRNIV